MSIGSNIKKLREEKGISQIELAKIANVSDKAVSTWENDIKTPRMGAIQKIADYFGIPKSAIIEEEAGQNIINNLRSVDFKKVPILGSIACGEPILAQENIADYADCENSLNVDFALVCKGDSMINARINDGDIVFIRIQPVVENGEIAAVCIDGMDTTATLKRVYKDNDSVTLVAENPKFPPLVFSKDEANKVRIIGKAIAFQSMII